MSTELSAVEETANTEAKEPVQTQEDRVKQFASKWKEAKEAMNESPEDTTVVEQGAEPVEQVPANTEATPQEDPFAPKWKALTKREKALLEKERAIKEREAQIEEQARLAQLADENPLKFMQEKGFTYEKMIDTLLNEQPEKESDPEVKELRAKIEEYEKRQLELEEQRKQQEDQALARQYLNEVSQHVKAKPEYELINGTANYQLVVDVIYENYRQTGEEMAWDQAAELTEKYLEQQFEQQVIPQWKQMLELNKIKSKFDLGNDTRSEEEVVLQTKQSDEVSRATQTPVAPPEPKPVRTISNRQASSPPVREDKPMTHEERKRMFAERISKAKQQKLL